MCRSGFAHTALISILLITLASTTAVGATIYVKWDSSGPTLNGTSWDAAFHTVQEGLDAASSGDDVRVARGTYVETITLKSGIALYGGYAGVGETRNTVTHTTTLDGNRTGSVVTSAPGATTSTRLDGFTIRNGSGGVCCHGSSPTITNNTITCNWGYEGGGIFCESAAPVIANNIITGNGASMGGGVYCWFASPTITNNTIIGNRASMYGGGVYCFASSSPTVSNNIVAFNSSGIYDYGGTSALRNNCVFGNADYNYSGISAGVGDISADPLIAGRLYGNYHIQATSPCVNSGWNSAPGLQATDMDGQQRIQPEVGTVDVGVDESDGTSWSSGPYIIVRVSPTGDDTKDGSSWTLAKKTVQAGIDAARVLGGEVWVKSGVYNEHILLHSYAHVYGGFAGNENAKPERDWKTNKTILDGGGTDGPVIIARGGHQVSTIDGFTIRNGSFGGIYCGYSSPTIASNIVTGNTNGGINCAEASPAITGNVISENDGTGIHCRWSSCPTITNNVIAGNAAPYYGGGICCQDSSPTITNNTIAGNSASEHGGAIFCDSSSPVVSNNIIARNSSGVFSSGDAPVLRNNCVYGNTSYGYYGISAGTGDISADPGLISLAGGDWHLSFGSPCVDAGWNGAPGLPPTDVDSEHRVMNTLVDIGADEFPFGTALSNTKRARDSSPVWLNDCVVTASFDGFFYIEAEDRSSGIRIEKTSHGAKVGDTVNITGILKTNVDGERFIEASVAETAGMGDLAAVSLTSKALGGGDWSYNPSTGAGQRGVSMGCGLNNIGLLVRTWGMVTLKGVDCLYLYDGSSLNDGTQGVSEGNVGIRVVCDPSDYFSGDRIEVTGISSCFKTPSDLIVPCILLRGAGDVRRLGGP